MTQLQAQTRDVFKKAVESLLSQDLIPAEIYGHNFENKHISIPRKEFKKVFQESGETGIVYLQVDTQTYPVLIHTVQMNRLGDTIVHVDFYAVNMNEKTTAEVPLHFTGESPAVKEMGGVLVHALDKIEIEALPADLMAHVTVDISLLAQLNQSLHVKDLPVSAKVRVLTDPETVVAVVTEPKVEEEVVPTPVTPEEGEVAPAPEAEVATPEK
ncbi:MAG: 50S ribosomal protein L25 [Patescibacteria group bacterium]|nr:50S ribosomal protein L25 [Patescibacteria group bacterium]